MDILGDRLLARGGNMYARDVGLHYEVFSSVNARPRLEDLCSSGNALPKKVEQVGKGNKNSGDIYGSEVWGPGMSLAVRISSRNGTFLITTDASYLRSKIRTLQHCCRPLNLQLLVVSIEWAP